MSKKVDGYMALKSIISPFFNFVTVYWAQYRFHKISLYNSSIFFGANMRCDLGSKLAGILGKQQVNDPGLYLGTPSNWGRSKRHALAHVKGRILGKLQGWK